MLLDEIKKLTRMGKVVFRKGNPTWKIFYVFDQEHDFFQDSEHNHSLQFAEPVVLFFWSLMDNYAIKGSCCMERPKTHCCVPCGHKVVCDQRYLYFTSLITTGTSHVSGQSINLIKSEQ